MPVSTAILDRDGVVNHDSDAFIKSPAEWQPIAGSLEAIARLKHAGLRVVLASNQSGLGRGLFDYDDLFAIHDKMTRHLAELGVALDGIFFCPHTADDGCRCRKPRPGLLEDILRRWSLKPHDCVMIGDSVTDIEAARAAGIAGYGVRTGKPIDDMDGRWQGIAVYDDLSAAVDHLLSAHTRT
ncbi:D-glycero-beta-D-manno-heptose 1,7-bisphosphate 7-phosphatase [Salinisphaera sp. LB1]|uniref:D-glycero-beta-D-manno-heptose 1,7-bisphosphate 7-phosphatase n=1 Tax=Salinisphaera sp. LB1 TaxID=2183911 RepID=UPI000D705DA8|nr:D-glycero-beta-D-manno-heptose 1,7-bisphosphate 7-phosphatase [Salinisphaera sp. LB1]AWN15577.1 Histidinol-phosphatase [Salinisphaera sp. LB1]